MQALKIDSFDLLRRLETKVADERRINLEVIWLLVQAIEEKSYVVWGYSSPFAFMTKHLNYSESSAQQRILAAKLVARFPQIAGKLRCGDLHMSGLCALKPVLSDETCDAWLEK